VVLSPPRSCLRNNLHGRLRSGDRPPHRHAPPLHNTRFSLDSPYRRFRLPVLPRRRKPAHPPSHPALEKALRKSHRFICFKRYPFHVTGNGYLFLRLGVIRTYHVYHELFPCTGNRSQSLVLYDCYSQRGEFAWANHPGSLSR